MKIKTNEHYRRYIDVLNGDISTLLKLTFPHRKPATEADTRAASTILRRWLIEGMLADLCVAGDVTPTFIVERNEHMMEAIARTPSIKYFIMGGVRFNGVPCHGVYYSNEPRTGGPLIPINDIRYDEVDLDYYVNQPRIFFDGEWFNTSQIIGFMSNKLGGAHLDFERRGVARRMDRAARVCPD